MGAQPEEPVSSKLWQLMHLQFSKRQLLATLEIMADCSRTSMTVEQMHGSMAQLHRHHPEYGIETLVGRTLVLQLRRMMPSESQDERRLAKLHRQLQTVLRKNPDKASGRHALVADLWSHLRSRAWSHSTREVPKDIANRIIKGHARVWENCNTADKRALTHVAAHKAAQAKQEHIEMAQSIRAERDLLIARMEDGEAERPPLAMSQCALADTHFEFIGDQLTDKRDLSLAQFDAMRKLALEAPPAFGS